MPVPWVGVPDWMSECASDCTERIDDMLKFWIPVIFFITMFSKQIVYLQDKNDQTFGVLNGTI